MIIGHTGGVVHEQESKEMRQVIACSPNAMNIRLSLYNEHKVSMILITPFCQDYPWIR